MADLPAPTTPGKQFAYLLDWSSFYGNDRAAIAGVVNTYVVGPAAFTQDTAGRADMDASLADAVASGKTVIYAPMFSGNDAVLSADDLLALDVAAPYFVSNSVGGAAFDEPGGSSGDQAFVEAQLASWSAALSDRTLTPVPVWVNFSGTALRTQTGKNAAGIDMMGFEAYLDPSLQNQPNIAALMTAEVQALKLIVDATSPGRDKYMIVQGYNRNGAWTNIESLRNIQTPPYLESYNDATCIALWVFSWLRPGGTKDLPDCIRTEHERIWGAINSTTQPATINCSTPPPVHSGRKLYLGRAVASPDAPEGSFFIFAFNA